MTKQPQMKHLEQILQSFEADLAKLWKWVRRAP